MGRAVEAGIQRQPGLELSGVWSRGGDLDAIVSRADIVIDFSLPEGTEQVLAAVVNHKKPLVCGVSGLSDAQRRTLDEAARIVPLLYDRNMSLGIAVLERSVRLAATALGPDFEVVISETHHIHKKDAPSGTALKLGEAIAGARSQSNGDELRYEVERLGEVPGDHQVVMSSPTERLTFAHSVTTRDVFAEGALHAARWLVNREPGFYAMQDVLFDS